MAVIVKGAVCNGISSMSGEVKECRLAGKPVRVQGIIDEFGRFEPLDAPDYPSNMRCKGCGARLTVLQEAVPEFALKTEAPQPVFDGDDAGSGFAQEMARGEGPLDIGEVGASLDAAIARLSGGGAVPSGGLRVTAQKVVDAAVALAQGDLAQGIQRLILTIRNMEKELNREMDVTTAIAAGMVGAQRESPPEEEDGGWTEGPDAGNKSIDEFFEERLDLTPEEESNEPHHEGKPAEAMGEDE